MAVYEEVARTLESEIRHHFNNGEFLPSESELAKRFSINRHTVRRALDELVNIGMILRQHGKGSMVVDNRIEYNISSRARFTETLEGMGVNSESQVIDIQTYAASQKLANIMKVSMGTDIVQIDTLRSIDEQPVCLISHHLLAEKVPGISEAFKSGSLHHFLETQYQIVLRRKECRIGAALPESWEASLLRCPKQLPLLTVKSVNEHAVEGTVIEYSISRNRSDVFEMKLNPDQQPES